MTTHGSRQYGRMIAAGALAVLAATALTGCGVVSGTASAVGGVAGAAVDVAGAAVDVTTTTVDVVTSPVR